MDGLKGQIEMMLVRLVTQSEFICRLSLENQL